MQFIAAPLQPTTRKATKKQSKPQASINKTYPNSAPNTVTAILKRVGMPAMLLTDPNSIIQSPATDQNANQSMTDWTVEANLSIIAEMQQQDAMTDV